MNSLTRLLPTNALNQVLHLVQNSVVKSPLIQDPSLQSATSPTALPPGGAAQDPLAQLRDIHLPDPIAWWPPAPGWWLLSSIILATLIFIIYQLIKHRANNYYRREALQQLNDIKTATPKNNLQQCQSLLMLLRRTAKTAYPDLALTSELTPRMLAQLNQCCRQTLFDQTLQQVLGQLPYQANPDITDNLLQQLLQATEQWIKQHRHKHRPHIHRGETDADL